MNIIRSTRSLLTKSFPPQPFYTNIGMHRFIMTDSEVKERVDQILAKNRVSISRTITLIESSREEHRDDADKVMKELFRRTKDRQNSAIRIGICGSPGAGKSSLIEKLGLHITEQLGLNLAVLTIDPSSQRSGGSILGDKTRMERLSYIDKAYVRPSPTRGILGGIALNTGDVQQLCERAGYDAIIVESVGVGQSEIEIDNVADFVVYVVPPGSGDGLQGSKKGVMEIADLVVVNKYDSDYKRICERLKRQIESSLTLSMPKHDGVFEWYTPVELVSSRLPFNVESIWNTAVQFKEAMGLENLRKRRSEQIQKGMWRYLGDALMKKLKHDYEEDGNIYKHIIREAEQDIIDERISGHEAAMKIINSIFKNKM